MQKNAQTGLNAAILVAIIAGLIILYIVFLPTAEREKIVKEKEDAAAEESSNILLKESPGVLSTSTGMESEKGIPNIFLVETTNAKELESINPFIVRNGWVDKKAKKNKFLISKP